MIHFAHFQTFRKIPKKSPRKVKSSNLGSKTLKVGALCPAHFLCVVNKVPYHFSMMSQEPVMRFLHVARTVLPFAGVANPRLANCMRLFARFHAALT